MSEAEEEEKRLLDAAVAEYENDHDRGRPWREVLANLRGTQGLVNGQAALRPPTPHDSKHELEP